jgi:galactonate dehydratase
VDFHHRLTPAEAVSFAQALPRGALAFLEEPIRSQSAAAYATLRRSLDIPLAVGEEFTSKWEFDPFLNGGLIDFARLDVGNVGGLTEAMKISAAAETRYIDVMPHNPLGAICTAATAHLATAIPNLAWVEYRGLEGDTLTVEDETVIKSHHVREGTELRVAEVPGLGVEVNEEALLEPAQPTDFPRLRRVDGSYTNW